MELFGRTHSKVGNTNDDLILATRGKIKIQWGNRFVDILKDGKLIVEESSKDIITEYETLSDIDKTKNGLAFVKEDNSFYLVYGGEIYNLSTDDNEYVSYKDSQTATASGKDLAVTNIGLIFNTKDEAITALSNSEIPDNWFVYIRNDLLYYINNGLLVNNYLTTKGGTISGDLTITGTLSVSNKIVNGNIVSDKNTITIGSGDTQVVLGQLPDGSYGVKAPNIPENLGDVVSCELHYKDTGEFDFSNLPLEKKDGAYQIEVSLMLYDEESDDYHETEKAFGTLVSTTKSGNIYYDIFLPCYNFSLTFLNTSGYNIDDTIHMIRYKLVINDDEGTIIDAIVNIQESTLNKTIVVDSDSTHREYPSAKAVFKAISTAGALIDDNNISTTTVWSSYKTNKEITDLLPLIYAGL